VQAGALKALIENAELAMKDRLIEGLIKLAGGPEGSSWTVSWLTDDRSGLPSQIATALGLKG
jgi:hypothetical protein